MEYQDIELICTDKNCTGKKFIFTAGEQKFFQGLLEDGKIREITQPKRCEECRAKKKERFAKIESRNH